MEGGSIREQCEMGDGRWEMGDGRWEMGDGRRSLYTYNKWVLFLVPDL